jgi:hypothetical protein|tara:strand:+ start:3450 stop:3620 length:171 start_codon:yes stop_codon:yes gene_type:complete
MDKYLLKLMVCPKSGGNLEYNAETNELICKKSKLAYPIENDIPVMLISRARNLEGK